MKQFIKNYWTHVLLIILGALKLAGYLLESDWSSAVFATAFIVVALYATLVREAYDVLRKDHEKLLMDYIKELSNNLEFIQSSRARLRDIMDEVEENIKVTNNVLDFEEVTNPVTGEVDTIIVSQAKPKKKKATAKKKTTKKA